MPVLTRTYLPTSPSPPSPSQIENLTNNWQNSKGEKVTIPAHGGKIDIQGLTIARVSPEFRVQSLETFFDPLEMFRQIAPGGELSRVQGPPPGKDNESTGATCPVVMNEE